MIVRMVDLKKSGLLRRCLPIAAASNRYGRGRSLREGLPAYGTKVMSCSAARPYDASFCRKSADSRSTATTITKMTINNSETSRY